LYNILATSFCQQATKSSAKGADSDNSEVETTYVLSPQSEQAYREVNQQFNLTFERKSASFLLIVFHFTHLTRMYCLILGKVLAL